MAQFRKYLLAQLSLEKTPQQTEGYLAEFRPEKYAYAFSAKEQKLIKMRMARDPEFRKWFDDHTNALVEICGVGCRLEWKDRELVELGADGVVDEPLRDAAGNISFDNERPDRRILRLIPQPSHKRLKIDLLCIQKKTNRSFQRDLELQRSPHPKRWVSMRKAGTT